MIIVLCETFNLTKTVFDMYIDEYVPKITPIIIAMIIGVIFGTYSSIYISNTVLVRLNVSHRTIIKDEDKN